MKQLPILDISQFPATTAEDAFYANDFAAHLETNHKHITVPHKHNFYLSVLFTQGEGRHEIDFDAYPIRPGSVFLLNPGQTHHWELSEDIDGYIFFHTQAFYDSAYSGRSVNHFPFFYSTQNAPCLYLEGEVLQTITGYFKDVLADYRSDALMRQQRLRSLIDLTYITLSRQYVGDNLAQVEQSNQYAVHLQKLEALIEMHYLTEKSAGAYAEMMNMSPKHLNRIVQAMLGMTSSDLIMARVMLEAKRLLLHADSTVAETADALGFDDYAYFSRLFRKKCGETPSSFQKKY